MVIDPGVYELAFSYRDYGAEADFIEYLWQKNSNIENQCVLDIACGTGSHLIQFCSRGYETTGFDNNPDVVAYAKKKFKDQNLPIEVFKADMKKFETPKKFGLAINMLTSANLLVTNDDMISHLRSAARALEPDGIYIMEMFHPREYGFKADFPATTWEITQDDMILQCNLRHELASLDSIKQTQNTTMRISVTRDDKTEEYLNPRTQRVYLYQEFLSLVDSAGGFEFIEVYGALNSAVPLSNERRSWRMVPVLRRTDEEIS